MAEQPSWVGRIRPAAGQHAIEVMALAVEWTQPIDGAALAAAAEAFRQNEPLSKLLSAEKRFPGFSVRIESQSASVVPNGMEVVDFTQTLPDGRVAWTLSLRPEFFSCSCVVYSRWAEVRPLAVSLLEPVAAVALKHGSMIRAVGLQYSDAFRWDKTDTGAIHEVLRVGSNLLPSSVFGRPSLWHTHNGWFSSDSEGRRVLNNVNIELTEEQDVRVLRLNGQHRIQAVSFADSSDIPLKLDAIARIADTLHLENKRALQAVLSDGALHMINMTKVED
jgi:uncharacterized protein (TIGR04255 family)